MVRFWCHTIAMKSSFLTTPKLSELALYFWRNPSQKHKKRFEMLTFETSNDPIKMINKCQKISSQMRLL